MPDQMLGALSKSEFSSFFNKKAASKEFTTSMTKYTGGYDSLEDSQAGDVQWDHEIDVEKEKDKYLEILARVVPPS